MELSQHPKKLLRPIIVTAPYVYVFLFSSHTHSRVVSRIVSLLVPVTSRARLRHSWISPLHLAAEHNRHTVAAVLLKTGADVNATLSHSHSIQYADRRTTALYFAIANGSTETAELLLKAGASLTLDPINPLLMAVKQGCISTVSLLLEIGADVNASIPAYPTTFPGAVALCMNNLLLLKCLLDNGCNSLACFTCTYGSAPHPSSTSSNINTGSEDGYTVLHNDGIPPLTCTEQSTRATQVRYISKNKVMHLIMIDKMVFFLNMNKA